ncbi:MAG: efflux RND transporter periplasmic adaptor subunit [Bacteroidales bacterium]
MKKTIVITLIVVLTTIIALFVFNKITSKKENAAQFTEVSSGKFEITVTTTGELVAENSIDIKGPQFSQGRDVRATSVKITDLVPEGTVVKKGDFVANLDKTELDNSLKDARDRLTSLQTDLEMALLDTAMTMNGIRDQINNQKHTVDETSLTFRNSKYESPQIQREAEINSDQAKRVLDQLNRTYTLRDAQSKANIKWDRLWTSRIERRVKDYENVLANFTIYAPASGMIIYYRNRFGTKRMAGSYIDSFDRVVATLPDLTSMLSKAFVSEIEINKVKKGQKVTITIDAFPAKTYSGTVKSIANIGEKLPNTDTKVFEVMIKIDGTDVNLRPSMTTNNKIMIESFDNVIYVPGECVHTGADTIPFVYTKSGYRQVVLLGKSNDKEIIIEKGLKPGTEIYVAEPSDKSRFRMAGEELIKDLRERKGLENIAAGKSHISF